MTATAERDLAHVAAELQAAVSELRALDMRRDRNRHFGADVELELHASRARERVEHLQAEFDELRRQADDDAAAAREREAAAREAARKLLETERDRLTAELADAYEAIETSLAGLVDAIAAATAADASLDGVDAELGERVPRRTRALIQNRVGRRLRDVGLRDLFVIGTQGLEPLPAAARGTTES